MSAQEDPNASGTESEAFAPDEDFLEADADASTELAEGEEGGEEYETDVEAPEEVSAPGFKHGAPASSAGGGDDISARASGGGGAKQLSRLPAPLPQVLDAAAREVARKERERLKQQDKIRREQLERMRLQQNSDASRGDVRWGAAQGRAWPGLVVATSQLATATAKHRLGRQACTWIGRRSTLLTPPCPALPSLTWAGGARPQAPQLPAQAGRGVPALCARGGGTVCGEEEARPARGG